MLYRVCDSENRFWASSGQCHDWYVGRERSEIIRLCETGWVAVVIVGVAASIPDVVLEASLPHVKGVPFCCFRSVGWPVTTNVDVTVERS